MSLPLPPSSQFAEVFKVDAKSFLRRQDAFVASVVAAIGALPTDLVPGGLLLLDDYRADQNSDGYLRFSGSADGQCTVLIEVASLRRSSWFRGRWYDVMANVWLPEGAIREAWELLQTGAGLDRYRPLPDGESLSRQLAQLLGRPVLGTAPGNRVRFQ